MKRNIRVKRKVKIFFSIGLLVVLCVGAFIVGTKLGIVSVANETQEVIWYGEEPEPEVDEGIVENIVIEDKTQKMDILILVNRNHPLSQEYEVSLLTLPDGVNRAAEEAYQPLCDMLAAGRKEGLSFEICSSYRDVERQKELFFEDMEKLMLEGYSKTEAYEEVAKETMLPGCSEHATGLAFDIVALDYQMLDEGQERTPENIWLQEHCAEYGFILRYPRGKEDITSINYESWHFRYVGIEAAQYIMDKGLTLEEYLEEEKRT